MKVLTVVGTRPQLIKAAALQPVLRRHHQEVFVDTAQHSDDEMAGEFYRELDLASPDYSLGVSGGSQSDQLGRMLPPLDAIVKQVRPDVAMVVGDTNSTLAGALAAATNHVPICHVEAGMRSYDRRMPEEINRLLTDHLAALLFAPNEDAVANLAREGIRDNVRLVGDVLRDLCARFLDRARRGEGLKATSMRLSAERSNLLSPGAFILATVHRAENREPQAVREWVALLDEIASPERPVLMLLHPGTRAVLADQQVRLGQNVLVCPPVGYVTTLSLLLSSAAVATDSGGVQREAMWIGTPCLLLRDMSEWTIDDPATCVVIGRSIDRARDAVDTMAPAETSRTTAMDRIRHASVAGDGAAEAIVADMGECFDA